MARNIAKEHENWLKLPGAKGQAHKDNKVRIVHLPPRKSPTGWDVSEYLNRWNLIEGQLET